MTDLLVLKRDIADYKLSRDFEWVFSLLMHECARIFNKVDQARFVRFEQAHDRDLRNYDYVLLLDEQTTYATTLSLSRMKRAIDAGAQVVVPRPIASFDLRDFLPIATLSRYEQCEQRFISGDLDLSPESGSHLPISMFSGEAFSKLSTVTPLPELMSNPAALEQNTELVVARAGIFHLFFDPVVRAQEHLLQYLPSSAKTVLDVGCALGLTGKLLEERLGCQVTGIEQDPDLASLAAKNISRVIVGNVEELEIVDRYDIIVAIDLVEHLLFPDKFLEKMHAALNPGGRLLICVPNIGHYTIVEDLLCGRWDIMPGFLNYMHFRFFTRSALEKLLAMSGFSQFTFYNEITVLPPRYLQLPDGFKIDEDSLKTARFYVTANRSP